MSIPHPPVVTEAEWLAERKKLLIEEKELTRHYDRVAAERRRLPMVKIEKEYVFDTPKGKKSLLDLFEGRTQLVIYHFMLGPDDKTVCDGCESYIDAIGDISMLNNRNTTFAFVSRAPLEKLTAFKEQKGWKLNWYSSFGGDFNYDYHATMDPAVAPTEYNYKPTDYKGEEHALSVFFQMDGEVYHTYSSYARGTEMLTDSYTLLDVTPYGRQEDFENSPDGWPQKPTYG